MKVKNSSHTPTCKPIPMPDIPPLPNKMEKLLEQWKSILGLNDWNIVLEDGCSPYIMNLQNVAGETDFDELHKCAVIRIISEKDYGDRIIPFDKEKTLIHELLHIKFWFLDQSESIIQNRLVHQLIDDIARALVNAKRSKE